MSEREVLQVYTNRNQSDSRSEVVVLHRLFGDATLHWVILKYPQFVIFAFSASHSIEMIFYRPESMPSTILFHIQFSKSMSRSSTVGSTPILSLATLYKIPITSRYSNYGGCRAGARGGRRALVLQRCGILLESLSTLPSEDSERIPRAILHCNAMWHSICQTTNDDLSDD